MASNARLTAAVGGTSVAGELPSPFLAPSNACAPARAHQQSLVVPIVNGNHQRERKRERYGERDRERGRGKGEAWMTGRDDLLEHYRRQKWWMKTRGGSGRKKQTRERKGGHVGVPCWGVPELPTPLFFKKKKKLGKIPFLPFI